PAWNVSMGYEIVRGNTHGLSDVSKFLETLSTFFDPHAELTITRAPGRLDVMGGIADYSGSLVLELPIAEATLIALQRNDDRILRIVSLTDDDKGSIAFEMPLADFEQNGKPVDYDFARKYFQNDPAG